MNEHQRHTDFLRHCLLYDDSDKRHQLVARIARAQHDLRIIHRAVCLMATLALFTLPCLAYAAFFADNFSYHTSLFILNALGAVGVGSVVCFFAFLSLKMIYRKRLDRRREECRQLVVGLLESRLGKQEREITPLLEIHLDEDRDPAQIKLHF